MNLAVVISMEFLVKELLGVLDFGHVFADTGADQSVLEPAIRSFHFSFGLRRQGIGDLHIAILQDLLPLRGGLIGQKMVLIPEGVSSPDESKDGVRIDIIGEREPMA